MPTMNTARNSSPLAWCSVIKVTASAASSRLSVSLTSATLSRNADSASLAAPESQEVLGGASELHDVLPALLGPLVLPLHEPLVACPLQHLVDDLDEVEVRAVRG